MSDADAALGRHLMAVQAPPAGRYLLGLAVMLLGVVRAFKPYSTTLVSNQREETGRVAGMNKGERAGYAYVLQPGKSAQVLPSELRCDRQRFGRVNAIGEGIGKSGLKLRAMTGEPL
jgi:hypothetical protein